MKKMGLVVLFGGVLALMLVPSLSGQWGPDQRLSRLPDDSFKCLTNAWAVAVDGQWVHVVWFDPKGVFYRRSTDGGATWGADTCLSDTLHTASYPSIALTGAGIPQEDRIHVAWSDKRDNGTTDEVYYKRSTDGGASWGSDTRLTNDTSESWYPCIVALDTNVHVAWMDGRFTPKGKQNDGEILYKRSTNGGVTWGSDQLLSQRDSIRSLSPSIAAYGPNLHVAWMDDRDTSTQVFYRRSTDLGTTWETIRRISSGGYNAATMPSVAASGTDVHLAWIDARGEVEVYYRRSTDEGASWTLSDTALTETPSGYITWTPSVAVSGSKVYVAYECNKDSPYTREIYYRQSWDRGASWFPYSRLTTNPAWSHYPSFATSGSGLHLVWQDNRDGQYEIYYKRNPTGDGFAGCLTDSSNGRHLVRDPSRGALHLVMEGEDKKVYYSRSLDDGLSWSAPQNLGIGKCPSVGLAQLPWMIWPPLIAVCVAYVDTNGSQLLYQWNDGLSDPGTGTWHPDTLPVIYYPGPPSLVTDNQQVYVACQAWSGNTRVYCSNFMFSDPDNAVTEIIDQTNNPGQPCLAWDGSGGVHATWKRGSEIYYAPRGDGVPWSSKLRVDYSNDLSQQPFVECYGDSVFVVWADSTPFEVRRVRKHLQLDTSWVDWRNVSLSSGLPSESPTQAWAEFTSWAEDTTSPGSFDINYWRSGGGQGNVEDNPVTWSYWPHSLMWYNMFFGTEFVSAWTESPTPNQPPFTALTKRLTFFFGGGGGGDAGLGGGLADFGPYYKVLTGLDSPSPYCRKRDGVLRFGDKAVDYARDSLVYELPYLIPVYDYYLKVSSYRETGSDWAQALSVNGRAVRSLQFKPNQVDTAWIRIPPEAYAGDRKVAFSLKNVRGDYVTNLGLTLYQRDPRRGGKGGPQIGEDASLPIPEVFAVFPNPAKGQAQIEYSLRAPGKVALSVYDVMGRLVRKVVYGPQPAGVHKATWDGQSEGSRLAPNGVYFVRLNTPERTKTTRLVMVR